MKRRAEFLKDGKVVGNGYYDLLNEKHKELMHEEGRKFGAKLIRFGNNFVIGVKGYEKMPVKGSNLNVECDTFKK